MALSVTDPITPAIERVKKILFQPFDIGKWFVLGFSAFLAELAGEGGGSGGANCSGNPFGGGSGGSPGTRPGQPDAEFQQLMQWMQDHWEVVLIVVAAVVLLSLALSLLLTWLGCRGQFMFLDGVVRNRAEVRRPWRELAHLGNSLFGFRVLFGLATFAAVLLILGAAVLLAWSDIQARTFGSGAVLALGLGILLLVAVSLASAVVNLFLHDFVIPIMYLRGLTVMPAWSEFQTSMLSGRAGVFVLYCVFQIVIGIAMAFIASLAMCFTLCLAALPYLGSVILLPLSVFHRSYSLYFIEQFGPEWRIFPRDLPSLEEEFPDTGPTDERFYSGG
jgi:hypothetical protein